MYTSIGLIQSWKYFLSAIADIVFMRTWYPVEVPQFYATVTSLLLPPAEKAAWVGMKTLGQLKRERSIMGLQKEDSLYKVGNNQAERTLNLYMCVKYGKGIHACLNWNISLKILSSLYVTGTNFAGFMIFFLKVNERLTIFN